MDHATTLSELKLLIEKFVEEREWVRFHSPKNLSMAIGVEAAELMNLFRWRTDSESIQSMQETRFRKAAKSELADVVILSLAFANRNGIDISKAVKQKVKQNRIKYPVSRFKGRT